MSKLFTIVFLLVTFWTRGQISLTNFEKLVKLGELYSMDVNGTGNNFKKIADSLRTPETNHIIDALIAVGEVDKKLLTHEFLTRPDNKELKLWYVLREVHYNNQLKDVDPGPNKIVAQETLEKEIDERWLVDNCYYRINSGIGKLFNTENLTDLNIELSSYGLKNDTEKAILYFNLMHAFTTRFVVLQKNYDKVLEFAAKLPNFNGRPYFEFKEFGFEDFDWIGYQKVESYKSRCIKNLYNTLTLHFAAADEKGLRDSARSMYFNSILFVPDYFKYSGTENVLQDLFKKSKK